MAKKLIHLPNTNISLEKLPPIRDKGSRIRLPEKAPTSPLVPMTAASQTSTMRQNRNSFVKNKEPKFVPYEPYKAAITPLEPGISAKKRTVKRNKSAEFEEPVVEEMAAETTRIRLDTEEKDEAASLDVSEKDREINDLLVKLTEAEKQLRIQTQVNAEVKRLLVASVGEDIEAKVCTFSAA